MKKLAMLGLLSLSLGAVAWATPKGDSVQDAIKKTNGELVTAVLGRDSATLTRLLADDLRYVHGDGHYNDKKEFLFQLGSSIVYKGIEFSDEQVRSQGDLAILTAKAKFSVAVHGANAEKNSYVTRVFSKQKGQWRLAMHQATPVHIPTPAVAPKK